MAVSSRVTQASTSTSIAPSSARGTARRGSASAFSVPRTLCIGSILAQELPEWALHEAIGHHGTAELVAGLEQRALLVAQERGKEVDRGNELAEARGVVEGGRGDDSEAARGRRRVREGQGQAHIDVVQAL